MVIVHGYRDPVTKKVRHKTIKSLGYLDDLKKQFEDPIAHFRAVVEKMNRAAALEKQEATVNLDTKATLAPTGATRKNVGYAAISRLYHELGLRVFFNNHVILLIKSPDVLLNPLAWDSASMCKFSDYPGCLGLAFSI